MKFPIVICMIVLALDYGASHSPLDKVLRRLKRGQRNIESELIGVKSRVEALENRPISATEPYLYICGAQDSTTGTGYTIKYDYLMIDYKNIGGYLDINTGTFTSAINGLYSVSYAMMNYADYSDAQVNVYVRRDGTPISETRQQSQYEDASGYVKEGFGRELPLYLNTNETLDIFFDTGPGSLRDITFCITLAKEVDGPAPTSFTSMPLDLSNDDEDEKRNNTNNAN